MKIFTQFALLLAGYVWSCPSIAQETQESLFERIEYHCEGVSNNGLWCTYTLGDTLEISIKDVGGTDTLISFRKSDWDTEFYAVMYFGCPVITPGTAHPRVYDSDYGIYISPRNGAIYRTKEECIRSLE
jgi:hypothetical protein